MKKLIMMSLSLILTACAFPACAESKLLEVDTDSIFLDLAVHDNAAYFLLLDGAIFFTASDRNGVQEFEYNHSAGQELDSIVFLADGLYGYYGRSGEITQLAGVDNTMPAEAKQYTLPSEVVWEEGYIRGLQAQDQAVSFIYTPYASESISLCRFDLVTQEFNMRKMQVSGFCTYRDNKLVVMHTSGDKTSLSLFDWVSGSLQEICPIPFDATGVCHDPSADVIYYCDSSNLMRVTMSGTVETAASFSTQNNLPVGALLQNQFYVSCGRNGLIYLCDLSAPQETVPLTVLGESFANEGYKKFIMTHPNVAVDISRSAGEYPTVEEFVQGFLTGDIQYDVMRVSTGFFDISLLMEKGYCEDLTSNSYLMEQVSRMYPSISKRAFSQDRLLAVPCSVSTTDWESYYPAAWDEAGFSADDLPRTFHDFLIYLWEWTDQPEDIQAQFLPFEFYDVGQQLFQMMLKRYTALYAYNESPLDFDTELFRSLLAGIEQTLQAFKLRDDVYGAYLMNSGGQLLRQPMLALPLSEDAPGMICGSLDVYIINPRSPNRDLAVEYVSACISSLPDLEIAQLYSTNMTAIESEGYQAQIDEWEKEDARLRELLASIEAERVAEVEDQIASHQLKKETILSHRYSVTPELLEDYRNTVAPNLFFPAPTFFNPDSDNGLMLDSIIQRYLDGQSGADQLIQNLNQKIRMMQMESR